MVSHVAFHFTEKRMTLTPKHFMDVQPTTQANYGVLQPRKGITHGAVVIGTGVDRMVYNNPYLFDDMIVLLLLTK